VVEPVKITEWIECYFLLRLTGILQSMLMTAIDVASMMRPSARHGTGGVCNYSLGRERESFMDAFQVIVLPAPISA
jgi:hypothetical protein